MQASIQPEIIRKEDFSKTRQPKVSSDDSSKDCCPNFLSCFLSIFCCICATTCLCGFCKLVPENASLVLMYWGELFREVKDPGLHCINPCGLTSQYVSTKQESIDLPNIKVVDLRGNPIHVSGMVRYRVEDISFYMIYFTASLEVSNYGQYILNQAQAVLKQVCSRYPYYTNDDAPSLKESTREIQKELVENLQLQANNAGVKVLSVDITDLSYAPEIAGMMLVRQQAEARIEARDLIVVGAVDIVTKAVQRLEQTGVKMSSDQKANLVSNLLTVLCSDTPTQPVVNTN